MLMMSCEGCLGRRLEMLVEVGGVAPKGGWAHERGDPPKWGVAVLLTTSTGGDSSS